MSSLRHYTDPSDIYAALLTSNNNPDPPMTLGSSFYGVSKSALLRAEQHLLQARAEERRRALLLALSSSNPCDDALALQEARTSLLRQSTAMTHRLTPASFLSSATDRTVGVSPPPLTRGVVEFETPAWNVAARESQLDDSLARARMRLVSSAGGMKPCAATLPSQTASIKSSETSKPASKDEPEDEEAFFEASGSKERFPAKLYRMIFEMDKEGRSDVISFLPHGKAFAIHQEDVFIAEVLPRYFTNCQLPSFQKQLNLYGFHKITVGKDKGKLRYFHASFLKGKPSLTEKIQRRRVSAGKRK